VMESIKNAIRLFLVRLTDMQGDYTIEDNR